MLIKLPSGSQEKQGLKNMNLWVQALLAASTHLFPSLQRQRKGTQLDRPSLRSQVGLVFFVMLGGGAGGRKHGRQSC